MDVGQMVSNAKPPVGRKGGNRASLGQSGLAVVEYAIIMPLLIFLLILLLFVIFTLHDRAVLQSSTAEMAESLSRVWRCGSNPQSWMDSGDWSPEARDGRTLYWQLGTVLSEEKGKTDRIAAMLSERLKNRRWLPKIRLTGASTSEDRVSVSCRGGIPFATIHVESEMSVSVPAANLMRQFGWDGVIRIRASADALVTDPKSLMQDVDWGLQMLQQSGAGKLYGTIVEPVRSWYGKAVLATKAKPEVE